MHSSKTFPKIYIIISHILLSFVKNGKRPPFVTRLITNLKTLPINEYCSLIQGKIFCKYLEILCILWKCQQPLLDNINRHPYYSLAFKLSYSHNSDASYCSLVNGWTHKLLNFFCISLHREYFSTHSFKFHALSSAWQSQWNPENGGVYILSVWDVGLAHLG